MKSFLSSKFFILLGFISIFSLTQCVKGEYDAPPSSFPVITPDQVLTFDELFKKLSTTKATPIAEDKYIEAVVVADDRSGNFYKSLVIEDLNGDLGLSFSIDDYSLYALYPVGQKLIISLKDLSIGYFEGLPTLGVYEAGKVGRIPAGIYKSLIFKGASNLPVVPLVVDINELSSKHYNRLIQLENMQFQTASSTTTYADATPGAQQSVNHTLENCNNKQLILRNSGFADFASDIVPTGNGTVTCVYSYYRNAAQLFIRDVTDLNFTGARCDGSGGGITGDRLSIESLRAKYTGSAIGLTKDYVQGVVISDIANKNINAQNIVVQDGDYGILLRFKSEVSIPLGTEVKVGLAGGSLEEYKLLLQVQNLDNTSVEVVSNSKTITPKTLTVAQIDIAKHESTLIKIDNATLSGGTKYGDKIKVTDATGSIDLYTIAASTSPATFASTVIKSGTVSVTAIVSQYDPINQLTIRNLNDITGGGPCDVTVATGDCDGDGVQNSLDCAPENAAIYPGAPCDDGNAATVNDKYNGQCQCVGGAAGGGFEETFSSQTNNVDIAIQNWINVAVKGTRKWQGKLFSGNTYAQATAYNDTNPEMETWLVSPVISTSAAGTLTFESAKAFLVQDGLSVWVTSNYSGDPATTTWTNLNAKVAAAGDADNTFIPSGNISLTSHGANVRVGFKYVGNGGSNTSTFRIDNVKVK